MGLMTNYLISTGNLPDFLNAVRTAKAPERFTHKFLKDLGFTSSNDRLLIGVLKGLGFLDESGVPQQDYFDFLDQSQSGAVLAEAIQTAYEDLFALNRNAQDMDLDEVKGKFRTLTQGQKSERVVTRMASTFKALTELADWSSAPKAPPRLADEERSPSDGEVRVEEPYEHPPKDLPRAENLQLHYNIQLVLPPSRDPAVFDALFTSLRKHLL